MVKYIQETQESFNIRKSANGIQIINTLINYMIIPMNTEKDPNAVQHFYD